jgi:hypothetical protein
MIMLFLSIYVPKLIPIPFATYNSISNVYPKYAPLSLMYNKADL